MTAITNIAEIRADLKVQQAKVLQLSSMTEMEYSEFQFEIGLAVLEANIANPEDVIKVSSNKMYWNYFRLQWIHYEELAIRFIERRESDLALTEYKRRMSELVHSRKMWLSLRQFFTLFKII